MTSTGVCSPAHLREYSAARRQLGWHGRLPQGGHAPALVQTLASRIPHDEEKDEFADEQLHKAQARRWLRRSHLLASERASIQLGMARTETVTFAGKYVHPPLASALYSSVP